MGKRREAGGAGCALSQRGLLSAVAATAPPRQAPAGAAVCDESSCCCPRTLAPLCAASASRMSQEPRTGLARRQAGLLVLSIRLSAFGCPGFLPGNASCFLFETPIRGRVSQHFREGQNRRRFFATAANTTPISTPTWQNMDLGQFKVILEREIRPVEANYS